MSNLLDKMIADLEKTHSGENNQLLIALQAKRRELKDDATDQDIAEAIQTCLMENFSGTLDEEEDEETMEEENEPFLSDEDMEYLEISSDAVNKFLDSNHWSYATHMPRENLILYEFGLNVNHARMGMKILIEANPHVCRINAVLPIAADSIYEYPLCQLLTNENYNKRFGSFKYDARDGEVSYEHSFFAPNGVQTEELAVYFRAVLESATSAYDIIRRYCVGKFRKEEIDEILKKTKSLLKDIT